MRKPLNTILILFAVITLVPLAFLVFELSQLNANEKLVRDTYQNQLEAILYSVNQYSDDLISSWANRIRLEIREGRDEKSYRERLHAVLDQTDVVRYVYLSGPEGAVLVTLNPKNDSSADIGSAMKGILEAQHAKVERLVAYGKEGFRKMEAIDTLIIRDCMPVLFVLDEGTSAYTLAAMIIDQPAFIVKGLAPKMQAISQEKFIISARQAVNDSLIYSTGAANTLTDGNTKETRGMISALQTKSFWILPGYYLGIKVIGSNVEDLVKERTITGLTILFLLGLILITGFVFLYRNIRREIRLSQAKAQFVSNVSHELRTPLSLIGLFAETLESGRATTEEKKMEYYGIISKEVKRLSGIVNRILNFSQLDANKKLFTMAPVGINELCQRILENYFYPLREKGFTFDLELDPAVPSIHGDREAITEAIINLVDNAVKYSRDKKHIIIATGIARSYCFVEVKDNGIGIAKSHRNEIFEQFYRAPTGDVHTTQGSGLGLTLVKKIMNAHGGRVSVESDAGKGSTFRLEFPIQSSSS